MGERDIIVTVTSLDTYPVTDPPEILRTLVGSTIHGLSVADQDDIDYLAVTAQPLPTVGYPRQAPETFTFRTQPDHERSGPGDIDYTAHTLRKFLSLVLKGNPTIMLPLFVPPEHVHATTPLGEHLREPDIRSRLLSQQAAHRYLGYLDAQRRRMYHPTRAVRQELIDAYGYDTKYMGHIIRLAVQGYELLSTARLSLPMRPLHRNFILDVRTGRIPQATAIAYADYYEQALRAVLRANTSPLRPEPDVELADRILQDALQDALQEAHRIPTNPTNPTKVHP